MPGAFSGERSLTQLDDLGPSRSSGREWQVDDRIAYYRAGILIEEALPGFVSDGATMQESRLRWLLQRWGSYTRPVVIHDVLTKKLKAGTPNPAAKTWREAALLFNEMLEVDGTGRGLRFAMFAVVYLWALRRDLFA